MLLILFYDVMNLIFVIVKAYMFKQDRDFTQKIHLLRNNIFIQKGSRLTQKTISFFFQEQFVSKNKLAS